MRVRVAEIDRRIRRRRDAESDVLDAEYRLRDRLRILRDRVAGVRKSDLGKSIPAPRSRRPPVAGRVATANALPTTPAALPAASRSGVTASSAGTSEPMIPDGEREYDLEQTRERGRDGLERGSCLLEYLEGRLEEWLAGRLEGLLERLPYAVELDLDVVRAACDVGRERASEFLRGECRACRRLVIESQLRGGLADVLAECLRRDLRLSERDVELRGGNRPPRASPVDIRSATSPTLPTAGLSATARAARARISSVVLAYLAACLAGRDAELEQTRRRLECRLVVGAER